MTQTQYEPRLANIFSLAAREPVKYRYHSDQLSGGWNVFSVICGVEYFEKHFDVLKDAQDFCKQMNGEA